MAVKFAPKQQRTQGLEGTTKDHYGTLENFTNKYKHVWDTFDVLLFNKVIEMQKKKNFITLVPKGEKGNSFQKQFKQNWLAFGNTCDIEIYWKSPSEVLFYHRYQLMMKCWENDPDKRPTFTDLKNQLKEMENQHRVRQRHILFYFFYRERLWNQMKI